jgi:hypothetical protein
MIYFKKIEIPNFSQIQKELKYLVVGKFPNQSEWSVYDPPISEMSMHCPTLHRWILEHNKLSLRFYRIYSTPAMGRLNPHIDGGSFHRSPIGLNIPIQGCENSVMKWWDESTADVVNGNFGYGNIPACRILNPTELTCLAETEINQPTFVRTDIIHSVENYNPIPRVLLSVRWAYDKVKGQQFEDVIQF